jgi:hypothetical protein
MYDTSFFLPSAMCDVQSWIDIVMGGVTLDMASMFIKGI